MKKFLRNMLGITPSQTVRTNDTAQRIRSAYTKRFSEIESLRKYDRGEKTITPVDLTKIVRSI